LEEDNVDFGLGRRRRDLADRVEQVCRTHCSADEESRRDASSEFPDRLYRALGSAGAPNADYILTVARTSPDQKASRAAADDAQALHGKLAAAGVPIVTAPADGPFRRQVAFADSEDYVITIHDQA
jgi:hypothetical protein